jgi:hypothetical protein
MSSAELAGDIERNFEALRQAMAERRYAEAQALLRTQRELFERLDIEDREAADLLDQARELTNWALTLARVQHSHTERAFASLLKLKQLDAGYLPSPVCSAELISIEG